VREKIEQIRLGWYKPNLQGHLTNITKTYAVTSVREALWEKLGSGRSTSHRWAAIVSSCCIYTLKQPASWYLVVFLPDRFLPQTKDILVPPIISRHFAVTIHISNTLLWTL